jgi:OFA family oxalate/formate antiporter-like MFS transporter
VPNKHHPPLVLIACCLAVFFPGALVFGFPGVMGPYWRGVFEVGRAQTGQILFYVLAGAGLFMFVTGRLQQRYGPARTVLTGALVSGAALALLPLAGSFRWVCLWAFVNGATSAFAYLPGMTVAQRWYPRRRGLAAGLVSMSFGIAGAALAPVFGRLLPLLGYGRLTLAAAAAVVLVGAGTALMVRMPEPAGGTAAEAVPPDLAGQLSLTLTQSLQTRSFWLLWFIYLFAGAAGVAMVTLSVAFGVSRGLGVAAAALILTAFNLTNGIGRLVSGHLSDRMGRKQIMAVSFALAAAAYFVFPYLDGLPLWCLLAMLVGFSFGTLHSVSAPLVSDCFGLENFGSIFGMVFTAFGFFAGALGPWLSGFILDVTGGNFTPVFFYLGTLLAASAALIWFISPRTECRF